MARPGGASLERNAGELDQLRGFGVRLMKPRPFIAVVDDDESVRESLPDLLRELGYQARAFASAEEFLHSGCLGETDCLILDVAMPGVSGAELQRDLIRRGEGLCRRAF